MKKGGQLYLPMHGRYDLTGASHFLGSMLHAFLPDNLASSIPQAIQGTEMNGDVWIFGTPLFYAPWR